MNRKSGVLMIYFLSIALVFALTGCGSTARPSKLMSSIEFSRKNVADGVTPAQVTVKLKSAWNAPLSNVSITLWVSGSNNVVVPCGPTDKDGISVCEIYSTKAEDKIVTASTSLSETFSLSRSTCFIETGASTGCDGGGHRTVVRY